MPFLRRLVFLVATVSLASGAPEPTLRRLTDTKGRAIDVTLLSADATSVKVRRESDQKEFSLTLSTLSQADRDFIAQWQAGKLPKAAASTGEAGGYGWSWAIPAQYEAAGQFENGIAPVRQGGKWGFINEAGKMVITPRWDRLSRLGGGNYRVSDGGERTSVSTAMLYELAGMNPADIKISPHISDRSGVDEKFAHGLQPFREAGKYGLKNAKGDIVAAPEWEQRPVLSEEGAFLFSSRDLSFDKGGTPSRFVDGTGKTIFDQPIGVEIHFSEGLAAAWKDLKHLGFIDRTGQFVVGPFKYSDNWRVNRWSAVWAYRFSEGLAAFPDPKGGPLLGYVDKTGKMVIAPKWQQAGRFSEGLALVSEDRFLGDNSDRPTKWVIIDKAGAVVGTPQIAVHQRPSGVDRRRPDPVVEARFKNGKLAVLGADNNRIILDRTGKVLSIQKRPDVWTFHEYAECGLFWAEPLDDEWEWLHEDKSNGTMELVDGNGRCILPAGCFDDDEKARPALTELFPRFAKRKYGVIDAVGKVVVTPTWDGASTDLAHGGMIAVRNGKDVRYLDREGKPSATKPGPPPWEDAQGWKAAYDEATKKWGFKDASGKFVLGPEWDSLRMAYGTKFKDGLAGVSMAKKWGFIDRTGKAVIPFEYEEVGDFAEGLAKVKKGGKYGFVDTKGALVIACEWDGAWDFSQGSAPVNRGAVPTGRGGAPTGGKWGLISRDGKVLVTPDWLHVHGLSRNRAWVSNENVNGPHALMDTTTGKLLTEPKWYFATRNGDFSEEGLLLVRDTKYGYIDETGKVVIPPRFDVASQFRHGAAVAWMDEFDPSAESGLIDIKGNWVFKSRPGARLVAPTGVAGSRFSDHFHHGLAVVEDTGPWGYVRIHPEQIKVVSVPIPPPVVTPEPAKSAPAGNDGELLDKLAGTRWKKVGGTSVRVFDRKGTFSSPDKTATFEITGRRTLTITFSRGIVIPCKMNEDCTEMVETEFDKATWRRER